MFTITRSSNLHFPKFWHFSFSNFQTTFVKIFTRKPPSFKKYSESADKVLRIHQYLWSEISRQWDNGPLTFFFFEICTKEHFASQILSNEGNINASILLILLKCIVLGCSDGNESFIGKLFSSYRSLNMLLHFFQYLIYSVFHETFIKKFLKKLSFFSSDFKNSFQDVVYYRKLRSLTLWYWNGGPLNIR